MTLSIITSAKQPIIKTSKNDNVSHVNFIHRNYYPFTNGNLVLTNTGLYRFSDD